MTRYHLAQFIRRSPQWARLLGRGILTVALLGSGILSVTRVSATAPPPIMTVAPTEARRNTASVGVVQSPDNLADWPTIMARLNRANIAYQMIDWEDSDRLSDFSDFSTLMLPNITQVSRRQATALEAFVGQGGNLIVTGAFGSQASSSVQRQLRSLVGAYWAADLPQPSRLRPASYRLDMDDMGSVSVVQGGVLMPIGLRSDTLATWEESVELNLPDRATPVELQTRGAPAVVTTARTTFLGWDWGSGDADTALDSAWMAMAFNLAPVADESRNLSSEPIAESVSPPQPIAAPMSSPQPLPEATIATSAPTHVQPTYSPVVEADPAASTTAASEQSDSRPTLQPVQSSDPETAVEDIPTAANPPLVSRRRRNPPPQWVPVQPPTQPSNPNVPTGNLDPAEQTAPPGLNIGEGAQPISVLEAIAMEQELKNVMGRFESALLSANAAAYPTSLQLQPVQAAAASSTPTSDPESGDTTEPSSILVASTGSSLATTTARAAQASYDILQQAKALSDRFTTALAAQDYTAARNHWLQARQLLWDHFPSDRPTHQTEIRAIWFDRGSIVAAGNRQGLAERFDRLAATGINTVFFETVNASYPIYPSNVAPERNPLIPHHWDPLADAVELAHERGMELHAWVWTFAAGNQRHNALVNQPNSYPGPLLAAHPTWANYDNAGRMIPPGQTKPFLDPANPQVRSYLRRLFTEIVTEYDVDGLQLDYIRYPFQDPSAGRSYGYGQAARRQFQRQTGVDPRTLRPSDRALWETWTEFRTQQIDTFVAEVSSHLRQHRPDLLLSAAVFPLSHHERMQKLQQNWEQWARQGEIDLIVTMSYAMDTNRLQQLTMPWLTEPANDLGTALVLPGIRLLNLPDSVTIDQIQALRDLPANGYALFAVENLVGNPNLQAIFSQTQGEPSVTTTPIPYRQPFATAAARFANLNQEWNYLLEGDRLWIRDHEQAEWHHQSQTLQTSLQQLAQQPSPESFALANTNLQQYQANFDQWMALYDLEHSYRVQTWSNHLNTISQLLEYGAHQLAQPAHGRHPLIP
ncbi:MAG: family 10 glycosylhydrolase [Cyanothece sp. SIO2G6]|nr:family 10 glycosylhydrolase [Cyanothece sp. SIO2G6]